MGMGMKMIFSVYWRIDIDSRSETAVDWKLKKIIKNNQAANEKKYKAYIEKYTNNFVEKYNFVRQE